MDAVLKQEELISVIVPVYRTEKYLPACIDSILAQSYGFLECILVDDGSPDKCGEICDAYAEQDARIKVIHQKNAGVSAARNAGLGKAEGEYITFVDSDDVVHRDYLLTLYRMIRQTGADISLCRFVIFTSEECRFDGLTDVGDIQVCPGRNALLQSVGSHGNWTACGRLFHRKYMGFLHFPEKISYGEDLLVVFMVLYAAQKVAVSDSAYYFYRKREDGATGHFFLHHLDRLRVLRYLTAYYRKRQDRDLEAATGKLYLRDLRRCWCMLRRYFPERTDLRKDIKRRFDRLMKGSGRQLRKIFSPWEWMGVCFFYVLPGAYDSIEKLRLCITRHVKDDLRRIMPKAYVRWKRIVYRARGKQLPLEDEKERA